MTVMAKIVLRVCESVARHTCVLDSHAVWKGFVCVAISCSEGRVHADDVTMLTGLDSLHSISLS